MLFKTVNGLRIMIEGYGVLLNRLEFNNTFLALTGYTCKKDDYKMWSFPDNPPFAGCILGKKLVIERRIAHAACFNGRNYDRTIVEKNCSCTREDYEW